MLSPSVSLSNVVIGDVADKFELPCQRVHAVTVTVCRRPDSNRRWLTPALKATHASSVKSKSSNKITVTLTQAIF